MFAVPANIAQTTYSYVWYLIRRSDFSQPIIIIVVENRIISDSVPGNLFKYGVVTSAFLFEVYSQFSVGSVIPIVDGPTA